VDRRKAVSCERERGTQRDEDGGAKKRSVGFNFVRVSEMMSIDVGWRREGQRRTTG